MKTKDLHADNTDKNNADKKRLKKSPKIRAWKSASSAFKKNSIMKNRKIKILAIDDNPDNLISLKALIKKSFPDVLFFAATNGIKGLELAATHDPDVVLLDIVMPEMDGFEVCKKVKSLAKLNDIPVVFITALKGNTLSRRHALEVGAEAFLAKPIDEYELTAQIRAMVKIKNANIEKRDRVKLLSKLVNERTSELNEINQSYINLLDDLKEENEARKKSEETYRILFESINDAVFISEKTNDGKSGRLIKVNKVACERLGYTEEELLTKTAFEIISERMKPNAPLLFQKILEKKHGILETEHVTKDGKIIPVEISIKVSEQNNKTIIHSIARDITERKKGEEKLKLSETQLKAAQAVAKIGSWETDLSNMNVIWSEETFHIFEIDPNSFQTTHPNFLKFVHPDDQTKVNAAFIESFNKHSLNSIEHRIITTGGTEKLVEEYWRIDRDEQGKPIRAIGSCQDITERKRAERVLQESEYFFKESQNAAVIGSYRTDFIKGFWKSSEVLDQIFGIDQNYVRSVEGWLDLVFPEDKEMMNQHLMEDVISKRCPFNKEYRIIRKSDAEIRWVHGYGKVDFDSNGNLLTMAGTIQDITDRKLIEDNLHESEEKFKAISNQATEGITIADMDGNYVFVNPAFCNMSGYSEAELLKKTAFDMVAKKQPKPYKVFFQNKTFQKNFITEITLSRKDGSDYQTEIAAKKIRIKNQDFALGTVRDITERKKAEEELKEINSKYQFIIENSEDILWSMNPDFTLDYISPSVFNFLGYTVEEHLQHAIDYFMTPESAKMITEEFQIGMINLQKKEYHKLRNKVDFEIELIRKDKTRKNAIITISILRDENFQIKKIIGVTSDITERKQSEIKLRESEHRYRLLAENVKDIIWVLDPDTGHFIYISPSVEFELGYTPAEMMQMPFSATLLPEIREPFLREVKQRIEYFYANSASTKNYRHEVVHLHKNGKVIYAEITNHYYLNETTGKLEIQGVSRDITERKKREKLQTFSNELLMILNSNLNFKEMVDAVLFSIRDEMKFSAVGMRIKIGDDFPYFAENGFTKKFLLKENSLIAKDSEGGICKDENGKPKLECTCGLVISGKTDPESPLFTAAGSFWTNNSYPLLELTPEQEPRFQPRNTCIHLGYGSIAIIPIRANGIIIGTLQLNDKKENVFTIDTIHFFESICLNIGNTLMRNLEKEKRKVAELELVEHAEELTSKNVQLTDFCNIISHNLRGPLVNISMLIDFIEQSNDQKEKDEILEKFKPVINTLNENFSELIESLQVKNDHTIKSEKINVKDCFQKIMDGMQVEITKYEASIEMDFNDAPFISFPQKYFKSILYNFLSNSLKYKSPEHSPVIKIKTEKINSTIVLSFADNGLGIDLKRHKKNLFKIRKVFHDHPDAKGFGLFITKTQVEAMGGKIWVESAPGEGSTFFIEFKNQNV